MPPQISKHSAVALLARVSTIPANATIPWITRPWDLTELYARLQALLDRSPRIKLLSVLKYAVYIALLLNIGSMPFLWHLRVHWHIFKPRLRYWAVCLRLLFASKKERAREITAWLEDLSPVGANPFEVVTVFRRWASLDDNDFYGMHLSNSCYAKALDAARTKAFVNWVPTWGRSGGKIALGGSHYHFIREIPPLTRYEVRLSIGAWDHKWLYVVARFVTRPSGRHAQDLTPQSTSTPSSPSDAHPPTLNGSASVEHAVNAILQAEGNGAGFPRRAPIIEPDGALLHCIAVCQMCFKWGRITTPPAVVLAADGFTKPNGDGVEVGGTSVGAGMLSYSRTNPPPSWIKSQALRLPPYGTMDNLRAFYQGKWRDVPEGERWWEDALGGSVEARRQANLEILEALKLGLERTRRLH